MTRGNALPKEAGILSLPYGYSIEPHQRGIYTCWLLCRGSMIIQCLYSRPVAQALAYIKVTYRLSA